MAVQEQVVRLRQLLEGLFSPLPPEAVKLLSGGRDWTLAWSPQRGKIKAATLNPTRKRVVFHPSDRADIPYFVVAKVGEILGVGNDRLYANSKGAFFQGKPGKDLEETLNLVRALRPLLEALGLSDLEGALEALAEIRGEEVRRHGPYVLAWSGKPEDPLLLRKGTILGDFALDGAFLLGREVTLRYPKAKVVLQGGVFSKVALGLEKFDFECPEWGSKIQFQGRVTWHALAENPVADLVREVARKVLEGEVPNGHPNRATVRLLEYLVEVKDPLDALKDEDFLGQVGLHLLSRF